MIMVERLTKSIRNGTRVVDSDRNRNVLAVEMHDGCGRFPLANPERRRIKTGDETPLSIQNCAVKEDLLNILT